MTNPSAIAIMDIIDEHRRKIALVQRPMFTKKNHWGKPISLVPVGYDIAFVRNRQGRVIWHARAFLLKHYSKHELIGAVK